MHRDTEMEQRLSELARKRVYIAGSDNNLVGGNLPSLELKPHSFVEFALDTDPKFLLGWGNGCFGIVHEGVLYWTCVEGLGTDIGRLVDLYRLAGELIEKISGSSLDAIRNLMRKLKLRDIREMISREEDINYALSTGLMEIEVDGRRVDDLEELLELLGRGIEEINVDLHVDIETAGKCRSEGIVTYDECVLKHRYGLEIEDISILRHVDDIFMPLVEEGAEIYENPERREDGVVIGKIGFRDIYLCEIFPFIEQDRESIKKFVSNYKSGSIRTYDEFLLHKEKKYDMEAFEDVVSQGLVYIKSDGDEVKVKSFRVDGERVVLIGSDGNEYLLRDVIRKKALKLPLFPSYENYRMRKNRYAYYVEWKMASNVKYSEERAPKNLNELQEFVKLGLVSVDGIEVKDIKIQGKEVLFVLANGEEREMYHYVAPQNRFEIFGMINSSLAWIRRFINEGYRERNALRLVLVLKKYEMGKKRKRVSVEEISNETGIPVEQLEIYLRSDLFKRFGELSDGYFYVHPDIEEFKQSVKVNRSGKYEAIVIDGRNVLHGGEEKDKKKGRVDRLLSALEYLSRQGVPEDRIVVIVKDAEFRKVDDVEKLRELEKKGIVRSVRGDHDDKIILQIALEERNGLIISNDNYHDFVGGNINKEDIDERLLKFNFWSKNFHLRRECRPKLEAFLEVLKEEKD